MERNNGAPMLTMTSTSNGRARLAACIARVRKAAGLTQAGLAEAAGIGVNRVKKAETGAALSHATLRAILTALDAAGASGLEILRQAVQAHQAQPQARRWRHLRGWQLGDLLPNTLRLKVMHPNGVTLPGGQQAGHGATIMITRPKSVGDYVQAVHAGLLAPASPEDAEGLEMHLKAETDLPFHLGGGERPAGLGWSGRWTRWRAGEPIGDAMGRLRAAADAACPPVLAGFVSLGRR
jgi:transcriptional regulator with XRE-family HTH domain